MVVSFSFENVAVAAMYKLCMGDCDCGRDWLLEWFSQT